jgi:hypothetical protein
MRDCLVMFAMLLAGCSTVIEPDTRPAFALDASQPFVIEFARGGVMYGMDVEKVDETGTVKLRRNAGLPNVYETASLQLSGAGVKQLVDLVNSSRLTELGRSYSDPNILYGAQWMLWIQQHGGEKSIYCNNAFPDQITDFGRRLDDLLKNEELSRVSWTPVPKEQGFDVQNALWARVVATR